MLGSLKELKRHNYKASEGNNNEFDINTCRKINDHSPSVEDAGEFWPLPRARGGRSCYITFQWCSGHSLKRLLLHLARTHVHNFHG